MGGVEREAGVSTVVEPKVLERRSFVVASGAVGASSAFEIQSRELTEVRIVVARRAVLWRLAERSAERVRRGGASVARGAGRLRV